MTKWLIFYEKFQKSNFRTAKSRDIQETILNFGYRDKLKKTFFVEKQKEKKMGKKTAKQDIGVFDITAALDRLSLKQLNNLKRHRYTASGITILTPMLGYTDFKRLF